MLFNFACRTLLYDRGKLLAGLVGVIFSVVLVNVQGGLFFGLINKAKLLVDRGRADIWVGHHGMHNVDFPYNVPERWIHRVRSVRGVQEAEPMRIGFSEISLPGGGSEGANIVGLSPNTDLGRAYELVEGAPDALAKSDGVIVDACDSDRLADPSIGAVREIGGRRAEIVGKSFGVLSFVVTPYIFTTYDRSIEYTGGDPSSASYFLVRLEPGADARAVCDEIERRLPDVEAMTADEFASVSVNFWMTRTGLGLSFGAATAMGLLVGLVMVAQTLYAMVLDRTNEFATLKAIGSTEGEIVALLGLQSGMVAVVGIVIGYAVSLLVKALFSTPRAEIMASFHLYVASGLLVFVVCLAASCVPYWRVRKLDPHSILQG